MQRSPISHLELKSKDNPCKNDQELPVATAALPSRARAFFTRCKRNPIITSSTIFTVLAVITFMILTCAPTCILDSTYFTPLSKQNSNEPFSVILFGDSLITGNHVQHFGLYPLMVAKIKSFIPHYNVNFYNFGHEGDGISALIGRLPSVLNASADAIIIMWDSDISANVETVDNIDFLRQHYISNLTYIIRKIQHDRKGIRIAIAGPGILGEGPLFKKELYKTIHTRKIMLNEYSEINRNIALQFDITYIDIRQAYLEQLPSYRLAYAGCLTVDGEHENDNGLRIISKLVAKAVFDWIND